MVLAHWQPLREFTQLQERMNRLFEDFLGERSERERPSPGWSPAVDIYEDQDHIILKADLPGIDQQDIALDVEGNRLTLRGGRRLERETTEENYHRLERAYGSFVRSFSLPNTVDVERIKASHTNGVLEVTLPKKEEVKPKQIAIKID
ncbi:MAG: Hsp20/alpha crystallin family protein [Candidatus Tectimicrobiota bacterium]